VPSKIGCEIDLRHFSFSTNGCHGSLVPRSTVTGPTDSAA
jgi:hypothetical protein